MRLNEDLAYARIGCEGAQGSFHSVGFQRVGRPKWLEPCHVPAQGGAAFGAICRAVLKGEIAEGRARGAVEIACGVLVVKRDVDLATVMVGEMWQQRIAV
jgi:hypothetical protein